MAAPRATDPKLIFKTHVSPPSHKGTCMTKIGLIAAAAVLAGGIGLAAAQTTGMPSPSSGANQGKCWDAGTNQVQDNARTSGTTGSTSGGVTGSTSGTSAGNGMSGSAAGGTTGTAGSMAQDRPAGAVGLPNC